MDIWIWCNSCWRRYYCLWIFCVLRFVIILEIRRIAASGMAEVFWEHIIITYYPSGAHTGYHGKYSCNAAMWCDNSDVRRFWSFNKYFSYRISFGSSSNDDIFYCGSSPVGRAWLILIIWRWYLILLWIYHL